MLTILHTEIPSGLGTSCRDSWLKYYLEPLKGYFVAERPKANGVRTHAPVVKAKAKAKSKAKPKAKPRQKAKPLRRAPAKKVAARAPKRKTARPARAKRAAKSVRKTKRSGATSKKPRRRSR
jgi:hypothetical protein